MASHPLCCYVQRLKVSIVSHIEYSILIHLDGQTQQVSLHQHLAFSVCRAFHLRLFSLCQSFSLIDTLNKWIQRGQQLICKESSTPLATLDIALPLLPQLSTTHSVLNSSLVTYILSVCSQMSCPT